MTGGFVIPEDHPRRDSLVHREKLVHALRSGILTEAGLIAHGRGEAFDYLLGERTTEVARESIEAAAAALLVSERPVISVNGNLAALCPEETTTLARAVGAELEVNLFYRSEERERSIAELLLDSGANRVLGVGDDASSRIEELGSERRRVDPRGILSADTVVVPLEDGDRTEALVAMGKKVISIDLNPLSRTSRMSQVAIVDEVTRCVPLLTEEARRLADAPTEKLREICRAYDNDKALASSLRLIRNRLGRLSSDARLEAIEERT